MSRRLLCICLAALGLLIPATASAAKPPAATVGKPTITWVRVIRTPEPARVLVRVLVHHAALHDPAPGAQAFGTATMILSRFEGDRNHSIAGGSDAWALPVAAKGTDVVYQLELKPRQGTAVAAAADAGVLRALVLVDERAKARGRAPARNGNFFQQDARIVDVTAVPIAVPPYLTGKGGRVVIDADGSGRPIITSLQLPISGGRTLALAPNVPVHVSGEPTPLGGKVTILAADGTTLATLDAPAGITLALSPTGRQRATITWPAFEAPGTDPVEAGTMLLSPPATR